MKPQEYKGKAVTHTPSGKTFIVKGGGRTTQGVWQLKDEEDNRYPIDECHLITVAEISLDVQKLRETKNESELIQLRDLIKEVRFYLAWTELEKDPVEAAIVAIHYCENWQEFCDVVELYGCSKTQSDPKDPTSLSARFSARCAEDESRTLLIRNWFNEYKQGKAA